MITAFALSVLPLLLIMAALKDAATMTIPNWISVAATIAFFAVSPFLLSPAQVGMHALVGFGALAVGFTMFTLNWIGGGDAKMLAAGALWLGLGALPEFLLMTALAGGGLSLGLLLARRWALYLPFAAPLVRGHGPVSRLLTPKGDIPYGLAICAGGLAAFPHSAIFLAALGL